MGMISWQGTRGKALKERMEAKGLMKDGKMVRSQEAIDEQAKFSVEEMRGGGYNMSEFLADENISYQKGSALAGRNYVKWRYDDPKYSAHHLREKQGSNASTCYHWQR
jgi:hypothetical protein